MKNIFSKIFKRFYSALTYLKAFFVVVRTLYTQSRDYVGVDVGVVSLAATNRGEHYGRKIQSLCKIVRTTKRMDDKNQAIDDIRSYVKRTAAQMAKDFNTKGVQIVVIEDLKWKLFFPKGKVTKSQWKSHGKQLNNWIMSNFVDHFTSYCEEYSIEVFRVPANGTSRICSRCLSNDKENKRKKREFQCNQCQYTEDVDTNAAKNILQRHLFRL